MKSTKNILRKIWFYPWMALATVIFAISCLAAAIAHRDFFVIRECWNARP